MSKNIRPLHYELDRFYWTENEQLNYEQELKRVRDAQAILEQKLDDAREEGIQKGKKEGREEGIQRGIQKVAINLLKEGYPVQKVKMCTGLSEEILNQFVIA